MATMSNAMAQNSGNSSRLVEMGKGVKSNDEAFIGVLDVYLHNARELRDICIYHKQDVYAKFHLTTDPEATVMTKTVNEGGKNPVFDENFTLNVETVNSSLKCEVWMLSKIKPYLDDQLLGFVVVPLSDVLFKNGKLAQEFTLSSLSSSPLVDSPAGYVQLSLTFAYAASLPDLLEIPSMLASSSLATQGLERPVLTPEELSKIEFPDPNIADQNEMMVSEYLGIPCANLDSIISGIVDTTEKDGHLGVQFLENFTKESGDAILVSATETHPIVVSTDDPLALVATGSQSLPDTAAASEPVNVNNVTILVDKKQDIELQPDQNAKHQEFVNLYNESMKQFTEALEKVKLPVGISKGPSGSENADADGKKEEEPKEDGAPSSKPFYGSRAFF